MIGNGGKTALACLVFAFGCGTTAALSDDVIAGEDPSPPARKADAGKAMEPTGAPLPVPENDGGGTSIECLGRTLEAWACEGFEGATAPTPPFAVQISNGVVSRVENRALAGAASLRATFDPIPETGKAQVTFQKPSGTGAGMSAQLSVYIDDDAHDAGKDIVLATLSGGATRARLHFVPTTKGNVLEVRTKSGTNEAIHGLGPAPKNGWACIEIEADKQNDLHVWRGAEPKVAVRLEGAAQISRVEVGIEWAHGANTNASKQFWFDDVVVAPRAVGCLH